MNNKTNLSVGVLLILLGLLFVANSLGIWGLEFSWPSILLFIGLGFILGFNASKTSYGMLMPGAILTLSSVPLFICSTTGHWDRMVQLWPIFLLGPSVGFILMYISGPRDKGLLIPALILGGMSIFFLMVFNYMTFLWPILFILSGLIFIYFGIKKPISDKNEKPATESVKQDD